MIYRFSLLLVVFLPVLCLTQSRSIDDTVFYNKVWEECDKSKHKYYRLFQEDTVTFNGIKAIKITDHYKNEKVQMTGYFESVESEKDQGLFTYFKKNGKIKAHKLYNFLLYGEYFQLDIPDQITTCDTTILNLNITYYRKGAIKSIGFTYANNKPECKWMFYSPFGKKAYYLVDYHNGLAHGKVISVTSRGMVTEDSEYMSGEKNGLSIDYNAASGEKESEINYKMGVKHGLAIYYDDSERIKKEVNYKDGKKHGITKKYRYSGWEYKEVEYDNGKKIKSSPYKLVPINFN